VSRSYVDNHAFERSPVGDDDFVVEETDSVPLAVELAPHVDVPISGGVPSNGTRPETEAVAVEASYRDPDATAAPPARVIVIIIGTRTRRRPFMGCHHSVSSVTLLPKPCSAGATPPGVTHPVAGGTRLAGQLKPVPGRELRRARWRLAGLRPPVRRGRQGVLDAAVDRLYLPT
jgi:hypothetical protein